MIQRIQTLYLLLAIGLLASLFYVNIAELVTVDGTLFTYNLGGFSMETADGQAEKVKTIWSIFGMAQFLNLSIFGSIFLFRKRVAQMRICIYNMILTAGLFGLIFFVVSRVKDVDVLSYKLPITFPIVALIFLYLAFRGIRKDYWLTKLDRIR